MIFSKENKQKIKSENLRMDVSDDIDNILNIYLDLIRQKFNILPLAKEQNDEFAMRSALLEICAHAMSLSSFFDAIRDDTEQLALLENWPDFPEDYKLPDHYKYPLK